MKKNDTAGKRKRANGEGTLRKRNDGRWEGRVTIGVSPTGRPVQKSVFGKTERECLAKKREVERQADQGYTFPKEGETVASWAEFWLEHVVKVSLSTSTYSKYKILTDSYVVPALGRLKLTKLTRKDVQQFVSDLTRRKSDRTGGLLTPATVRSIHGCLSSCLTSAVDNGRLAINWAQKASLPRQPRQERSILVPDQGKALLAAAKGNRLEAMVALGLTTGLRVGEAKSIRWSDVDFESNTVSITGQMQFVEKEWIRTELKTRTSRRAVAVPEFVMELLKSQKASQLLQRPAENESGWNPYNLVFLTEAGHPYHSRNINERLRLILKKAGLPRIRFHDLRHTIASQLLMAGMPVKTVSASLGHADTRTTTDTYGHVLPSAFRQLADTAGSMFGS